jgi:uncharacterized membrane protein
MSLGPLEFVVLAFPGEGLATGVQTALERVTKAGDLRVVDALVVTKHGDGAASAAEVADVDELRGVQATYGLSDLETVGLIATDDVDEVAALLEPGTTAVAMLVEHVWARQLAESVAAAGGELVASVHVPRAHADEAMRTRASQDATA